VLVVGVNTVNSWWETTGWLNLGFMRVLCCAVRMDRRPTDGVNQFSVDLVVAAVPDYIVSGDEMAPAQWSPHCAGRVGG
jgi:hypothetical protein